MPSALARQVTSGAVLLLIVCASATQTEVANYLTAERGYSKPFLTFYLTHSTFSVIFPLHLLVLKLLRPKLTAVSYVKAIFKVVTHQLSQEAGVNQAAVQRKLGLTILGLTVLISVPALCWFCAVPLTGVTDLTALYSTATFFTYGFSLLLLRTPLSRTILSAIVVAFLGVLLITFSGVRADEASHEGPVVPDERAAPPHRILGDLIMLVGAAVLGLYEVIYKLSLPEGQGGVGNPEKDGEGGGIPIAAYSALHQTDEARNPFEIPPSRRPSGSHRRSSSRVLLSPRIMDSARLVNDHSRSLPLGLHANFLTSCIGLATLALFWTPLPFLHWTGIEVMVWPGGSWPYIGMICMAGATYNAGFMILIGLLGPVTASVANLLAIGLVALVDALYLGRTIPFWTLAGAGLVGMGFGVLLWAGEGEPEANAQGEGDETAGPALAGEDEPDEVAHLNQRQRASGDGDSYRDTGERTTSAPSRV